jgi:hypothetical protein
MNTPHRNRLGSRLRYPEQLESRYLLSGLTIGTGLAHARATKSLQPATVQIAPAVVNANAAASAVQQTTLTAQLTDANSSATGIVMYQTCTINGVTSTKFMLDVKGATPSSTLSIKIGDTTLSTVQLTTDSNGAGRLELSSKPRDADEQTLPADFPTSVAAGATITVGSLSGSLAVAVQPPKHGPAPVQGTVLTAQLTDASNSSATGTVRYQTCTINGVASTQLILDVKGATPSSTLSIKIGDTTLSTVELTTDSTGAGKLVLSSNPKSTSEQALPADFPASVAAGTTITVGSLSGSLATPARPPKHDPAPFHGTVLKTKLTDPNSTSVTGMAVYHTFTIGGVTATGLMIKVSGAAANSTLSISIGGTTLSTVQLTTDSTGAGKLVLSSNPKGSNEQPLPADFPTNIAAGTSVTVGSLSGSLATSAQPPKHGSSAAASLQGNVLSARRR